MHHPRETRDFGSFEDGHRHWYPDDDSYHPREAADDYQRHFGTHHEWQNALPVTKPDTKKSTDNVLDDEDPAICFVKAYARKPLGAPKSKQVANKFDYWGDQYDNYGDYDNYSDSEDDFFSSEEEEEGEYSNGESEEEDSSEESSEEDYDGGH